MNINRLIAILTRVAVNRLLRWGLRRMHAPKSGARRTPRQQGREKTMREAVKHARQAARITRRMR
ncbi:hypothetical protein SAMN04244567_00323 [Paracoccus pantotrophus]|nr:hypothetical protein DTW92_01180 [Paracoccus pantotrophus]RNI17468.1 hypothetical protein EB844_10055 [Paracoccus pantotrophus]WGR66956.1 hypothetical protein E3U24_16975 [Paracoccus pantotrophus]SFN83500.1 hypothetical protein SAMN04244567_00323 [Paracoccus pantotrophus]